MAAGVLADIGGRPEWVRALAILALGLWLPTALLFLWAVAVKVQLALPERLPNADAFVDAVLKNARQERKTRPRVAFGTTTIRLSWAIGVSQSERARAGRRIVLDVYFPGSTLRSWTFVIGQAGSPQPLRWRSRRARLSWTSPSSCCHWTMGPAWSLLCWGRGSRPRSGGVPPHAVRPSGRHPHRPDAPAAGPGTMASGVFVGLLVILGLRVISSLLTLIDGWVWSWPSWASRRWSARCSSLPQEPPNSRGRRRPDFTTVQAKGRTLGPAGIRRGPHLSSQRHNARYKASRRIPTGGSSELRLALRSLSVVPVM